jgi:hypothetical protein
LTISSMIRSLEMPGWVNARRGGVFVIVVMLR